VYDKDYKLHTLVGFVLSDTNQKNVVSAEELKKLNLSGPINALILNHDDHVYTKVRFDNNTIKSFKKDGLLKIEDPLSRSLIWRNLWQQVLDFKLSATDFYHFLLTNLPNETVEDSVKDQMRNARGLINFFLPLDKVKESKEKFFDVLLGIASKPGTSSNIQEKVVENMDLFVATPQQSQLVLQWLEKGYVFRSDPE